MGFWVLIVAIAVNSALGLIILTRASRAYVAALFGISALSIAFWALGSLLALYGNTDRIVYNGFLLFLIAPMITALSMVLFARAFTDGGRRTPQSVSGVYAILALIMLGFVLTQLPYAGAPVILQDSGNHFDLQQPWYLVYGAYFVAMFSLAYIYLIVGVLRSKGRVHAQRKVVLLGIFATSSLALVTNIILPLMGNADFIWLGAAWTIFYVIATCYAMIKHGLFDLRYALALTFTYALSLTAVTIVYYLLALAVFVFFLPKETSQSLTGLNLAIALLIAFLFQPIRRFFDRFTSSVFYQDSYKVDDLFAELNRTLSSTNNLHILLKRSIETIAQTLGATSGSFVVRTGADKTHQTGIGNFSRMFKGDVDWLDDYLGDDRHEPKVAVLLTEQESDLRRMMVSHRLAVILPLGRKGEQLGYLLLGEHKRRSEYSGRDLRVISTLADELVIAIQNALSVEEIRELNSSLEQRVNSATKELRASNAQLQRLDEAKDEFISMASHQLRTPLTSIKGYISMLIEGDAGKITNEQKQFLNEAFVSSERMVRLIGDFLNVSRLQTGKFVIEKHPVDLVRLVQREIDGLERNAGARGIKFQFKAPKSLPKFELDENKIQQVVMNFADNAIYYSKDKSKVVVTLRQVDSYVEFTVKDTGIGVPKKDQAMLFNKFFRATNARLARPDGTGVGLFLAKKVIDDHNGQVIFESKEGKGSTFGFRLPMPR